VSQHVTDVVSQAAAALDEWWGAPVERRAAVLESIANALDGQVEVLSELAESETSLGVPRLVGEVARTTFQLRLFASALREGRILRPESDPEVSGSPPEGHAALARSYLPIGVVAVFGASNFPFAFGVLGGDSASALAAGCAVVVKVHPAHPRLSRRLIALAREAIAAVDAPQDLLTSVEGVQEGADLVVAREVKAVGFTGSQPAGRLLFDLASSRPDPIPFYGELSSLNPVAVTPGAARTRADEIAKGFAESLTLGAGQFCTKPAVVVVPREARLVERTLELLIEVPDATLLTEEITERFTGAITRLTDDSHATVSISREPGAGKVSAALIESEIADFLAPGSVLRDECFGPSAVVLPYDDPNEAVQVLSVDEGVLVGCVHGDEGEPEARAFVRALSRRVGRVVWNGWPTGVAVTASQMHGGPWPATTTSIHTSVGLHAVERFARPVVLQSMPPGLVL
jgi:NADP-dependent aldehyde dehydrogenase